MTISLDNLLAQGIAAARAGQNAEARKIFSFVLNQDKENIKAFWWLAQVLDDPHARRKCLEHTRSLATHSEQSMAIYRSLLRESGAPLLPRYKLAENSRSFGGMCPICTTSPKVGEVVVICPECNLAHHDDCWEENACHCGRFACDGSGLVDHNSPVRVEPAATSEELLNVSYEEISKVTVGPSREEQEDGFVDKLRQHAEQQIARQLIGSLLMQGLAQQVHEEQEAEQRRQEEEDRKQREEQRQAELMLRVTGAFLVGLIPGILLAIAVFQSSHNWILTLFTVCLVVASIVTAAGQSVMAGDRATGLYWILPNAVTAIIMYISFQKWENGLLAVVLASLGGNFLTRRLLRTHPLYEHRAFIVYSILALVIWRVMWVIIAYTGI